MQCPCCGEIEDMRTLYFPDTGCVHRDDCWPYEGCEVAYTYTPFMQPFGAEECEDQDDEEEEDYEQQDQDVEIALIDAILIVRKPNSGTESIDFDVDEKEYNESIDQILKVPFLTKWFNRNAKNPKTISEILYGRHTRTSISRITLIDSKKNTWAKKLNTFNCG